MSGGPNIKLPKEGFEVFAPLMVLAVTPGEPCCCEILGAADTAEEGCGCKLPLWKFGIIPCEDFI